MQYLGVATARGTDNCQMQLYRGTCATAIDVYKLSMAAYSAATALMTVQQGGPSMAVQEVSHLVIFNSLNAVVDPRNVDMLQMMVETLSQYDSPKR